MRFEEHAGIGAEVGFQNGYLYIATLDGGRQESVFVLGLREECLVVIVLEGHRKGLLVVGGVGEPGAAVLGEAEIGSLITYHCFAFMRRIETIGHALVVGSHLHADAVVEFQVHLAPTGLYIFLPIKWRLYILAQNFTLTNPGLYPN